MSETTVRQKTDPGLGQQEWREKLVDAAKLWLAHDGLWFRAVEEEFGLEAAIKLDERAMARFTVLEAQRIMRRLGMEPGGGIPALVRALGERLYAYINEQDVIEQSENRVVFRMRTCRVQAARQRQGLPDFPCKSVGILEYSEFARIIDPRIQTRCVACPPDPHPPEFWCAWEFTLRQEND
ncbi:MAG: DUF6125 family protein [Bacillota bacterium]